MFDVACGGRDLLETCCDGPIGTTVHTARATWRNEIGQAALGGYWEDKTFDPTHSAFYSARVPEIPTPRWTPYDAKVFGAEIPKGAPLSIQERSYTSPICTRHRFCGQGALRGGKCRKGSLKRRSPRSIRTDGSKNLAVHQAEAELTECGIFRPFTARAWCASSCDGSAQGAIDRNMKTTTLAQLPAPTRIQFGNALPPGLIGGSAQLVQHGFGMLC